ncbi:hypothetical protein LCGC14_1204180, partial [marine sediment metagenome]
VKITAWDIAGGTYWDFDVRAISNQLTTPAIQQRYGAASVGCITQARLSIQTSGALVALDVYKSRADDTTFIAELFGAFTIVVAPVVGATVYADGSETKTIVATSVKDLETHEADTTGIHGITDTADLALLSANNVFTGTNEFQNDVTIATADGIDYDPGSDTDVDLITIGVTGTPKLWWDEATDSFEMNKSLTLPGGSLKLGGHVISENTEANDDGFEIVGTFHVHRFPGGIAGNICLHEGTEPPVGADGDAHRIWANTSHELMWQGYDGDSELVLTGSVDKIVSPDGNKNLTITDTNLKYHDGTRDRLKIDTSEGSLKSPDGDNYFRANNTNAAIIRGGSLRLVIGSSTSYLRSSDSGRGLWVKQASVALRENGKDRLWIDNLNTTIFSPNLTTSVNVQNSIIELKQAGNSRIKIDANYTNIYSPDGGNLNIGNAGVAYNGATVQMSTHKGVVNGLAELDAGGIVPTSQLPAYVDAITEYASLAALVSADPQETNKVYITTDDNKAFRYTGTAGSYAEISPTLVLGTTSATAYRGDRGVTAYDHSQSAHNYEPVNANIVRSTAGVLPALDGSNLTGISVDAGNQLISPNEQTDLTVSNINLMYQDGSYARLYIDATESRLTTPNGQEMIKLMDGSFTYNDGIRHRLEINGSVSALISPSGAHTLMTDNTGSFYDGAEIATVNDIYTHPTGDGNKHVPANSTTNNGKVLTATAVAGTYTWQTPAEGHDPDQIISPDSLSNLTITNSSLIYTNNAGEKRFEADATQTRIRGVGATPIYMKFGSSSFEINDGVDRFMSNSSKSIMASPNDTWWSGCYNDRYEVMDDVRARIQANATDTRLISPDGTDVLWIANNDLTFHDGIRDRIVADAAGTRLYSTGVNASYIACNDVAIYLNDGARARVQVDDTHTYLFAPSGQKWVDVDNDGVALQGNTDITGIATVIADDVALKLKAKTTGKKSVIGWYNSIGTRTAWIGHGASGDEEFYIRNEFSGANIEFQTIGGTVVIVGLPTSAAGLPTGGLWNSGGDLRVA